jgi:hypothetical protein
MNLKTISASVAMLGFAAAAAQAVQAAEPQQQGAVLAPTVADAQARRVVRDSDTGKLRLPTAEEAAAMAAAERTARRARGLPEVEEAAAPVVRRHSNGMYSAKLGTEHLVTVTAKRSADGQLIRSHIHPTHEHPAQVPAIASKE